MNKYKILFYFLSFTWGLPMTLGGILVALAFLICGYAPKKWGGSWYYTLGFDWGGVSLGPVTITDEWDDAEIKTHEFGHAIQNCFFGPLMLFVVGIPSVIRYWYREFRTYCGLSNKTDYDDIWFEKSATELGNKYINLWK